jgi:transposase
LENAGKFYSTFQVIAWLGLTPRQNSSGGKQTLGGITKKGNRYIRKLLVLSPTSLLRSVSKCKGALADWISALLAKSRHASSRWRWPTSSPGSSGR